jgi:hypothetical protein
MEFRDGLSSSSSKKEGQKPARMDPLDEAYLHH